MSKMGSEFIRRAEAGSLDNAAEVGRLRAEVARLEARRAAARELLESVGMTPLVDVHAWLGRQAQFPMTRAVKQAGEAIIEARKILEGDA